MTIQNVKDNSPAIWKALHLMYMDNAGSGAVKFDYTLPTEYDYDDMEKRLSLISEQDMEDLCAGDEEDMEKVIDNNELQLASEFLNSMFEEMLEWVIVPN